MKQSKYYGSPKNSVLSYLEFGAIETLKGKKEVWDFKVHQKAYDWFMLGRYGNDLVAYIRMAESLGKESIDKIVSLYKSEVHHPNDASLNLAKLCALAAVKNKKKKGNELSFFELGQTIFGCIEGMEFYQKLINLLKIELTSINLKEVIWHGVDISPLLNKFSEILHEEYDVKTYDCLSKLKDKTDVFFAKGISLLYAARSITELMDILDRSQLCIFDYSFSMDKIQDTNVGTGKSVRYLNFEAFNKKYKRSKKSMYVRKNKSSYSRVNKRIFLDCVLGEDSLCQEFISLDMEIRQRLRSKIESPGNSSVLLDLVKDEKNEWIRLDDFMKSI